MCPPIICAEPAHSRHPALPAHSTHPVLKSSLWGGGGAGDLVWQRPKGIPVVIHQTTPHAGHRLGAVLPVPAEAALQPPRGVERRGRAPPGSRLPLGGEAVELRAVEGPLLDDRRGESAPKEVLEMVGGGISQAGSEGLWQGKTRNAAIPEA